MKESTYKTLMLVGLYGAIILLVLVTVILVKNIDEIRTDAIVYGINKNNYQGCSCYTDDGKTMAYDTEGFVLPRTVSFKLPEQ